MDLLDAVPTPTGVPSPTGFALARIYRVLRHEMDGALRDLGLTTPQWGALSCLARSGCLSGAEMARIHCTTPQTMHTILTNLEHAGLIAREPDPEHGHMLLVTLTPRGKAVAKRAARSIGEIDRRLTSGLDDRERDTLLTLLDRCMRSLTDAEPREAIS